MELAERGGNNTQCMYVYICLFTHYFTQWQYYLIILYSKGVPPNYTQYTRRYNTLNIHTGPCILRIYTCRDENNCVKILENMWISVADAETISDVSSLSCWCRTKLCRDGPIAHPFPHRSLLSCGTGWKWWKMVNE